MSTLLSSDMRPLEVDDDSIKQSRTIRNIIEESTVEDDVIPVPNVTFDILRKVVEFCDFHVSEHTSEEIAEFEKHFLPADTGVLLDIITAANFLDVPKLLDRLCSTVANMLRGKKPEEIRQILNVENAFTEEEEESVKKEFPWAFAPAHINPQDANNNIETVV